MIQSKILSINDCFLYKTPTYEDNRGSFREWFWGDEFPFKVVQGNMSTSHAGVIRGMHLNISPVGQAKWITCFSGEINDVIVDVRPNSSTYLKHEVINLNSLSGQMLCIPSGIAHGFVSLRDNTVVGYLVSTEFDPVNEVGINPLAPELGIKWGVSSPIISEKDETAPGLTEFLEKYSSSLREFL